MLKTAAVFSDNMVLQRDKKVIIWGKGDNGKEITVEFNGNISKTVVDGTMWEVSLPPMQAGGPFDLNVYSGDEKITFNNVMVGEVWLAGGQSNMELELQNCSTGKEDLQNLEDVNVRFYYTPKLNVIDEDFSSKEENSGWSEFSSENSKCWSAVAFYSAKKISENLGVTVGIIGCNWGGTSASAWMSRDALSEDKDTNTYVEAYDIYNNSKSYYEHKLEWDEYQEYSRIWNEKMLEILDKNPKASWDSILEYAGENRYPGPIGPLNENRPYGLYKTMISRVSPYTLRGFWYYQGESDDHKPDVYYKLFSRLIRQWREDWRCDELPFVFVQLPMFKYESDEDFKHWAKIREAQDRVRKTVKNTSMAVIIDCGELNNIHPTDKKTVGERLALISLSDVYNLGLSSHSPELSDFYPKDSGINLIFKHTYGGFKLKGDKVVGFEIAGADKVFFEAEATIHKNEIFVKSDKVSMPIYVRFCWTNFGDVTVYNNVGLPLSTFRTHYDDEK